MKSVIFASVLLASGAVTATEFVAADNTRETKLCMAAATGTPLKMMTTIKYSGYDDRSVARGIACNDEPINFFAARYNDDERVVNRLNRFARTKANVNIIDLSQNQSGTLVIGGRAK
ncbi:DUF3718 domain-containing protein [Ferrimonas gelatinilytica]|uniref:DUF3718 domain-containing protein n=1 Tax=Ferrimonas gelatinilytica TaxID=1255257 RepID=A0ABP9RT52_9GAMM